jgi:tRNA (cmo5U34)-methyltransferase
MTDNAIDSFTAHASEYNAQRRHLLPPYDRFYGVAVEALGLSEREPRRILDLGAGTGLLTAHVAERYPAAAFVLIDGSAAMLKQAQELLGERVETIVADFAEPLPDGPFDAVISALAIHHIPDEAKHDLYVRSFAALAPGGVFVNAEQVAGPTRFLDEAYLEWHATAAAARGTTPEQWAAALKRFEHDHLSTVGDQLGWLVDAGFSDVDCLMKEYCFAVLFGRRG